MGKVYLSYRFSQSKDVTSLITGFSGGYIADRHDASALGIDVGDDRSDKGVNASFTLVVPPDKKASDFDKVFKASNAVPIKDTDDRPVCSTGKDFKPRKLTARRAGGGTVSVVVSTRDRVKITAEALIEVLGDVVCLELKGEYWPNIYLDLAPNDKQIKPGKASRVDNKQKKYDVYTGSMEYEFGKGDGNKINVILPFRIDTDNPNKPPSILSESGIAAVIPGDSSAWGKCVKEKKSGLRCRGASSYIDHKRYIATFEVELDNGLLGEAVEVFTGDNAFTQLTEIPVTAYKADDIWKCGQEIAKIPATACLAYRGESDKRYHLRIK